MSTQGIAVSKYDELCEVAANARKGWFARKTRCLQYTVTFINGLVTYCGIPKNMDQVSFLRWNEDQQQYLAPENGGKYFIGGALEYDDEGDYWHLGLGISLAQQHWVSFGLCVSETDDGKPTVRVSRVGKFHQIDFVDPQQCNEVYDSVVASLKEALQNPRKPKKGIGFDVGSSAKEEQ